MALHRPVGQSIMLTLFKISVEWLICYTLCASKFCLIPFLFLYSIIVCMRLYLRMWTRYLWYCSDIKRAGVWLTSGNIRIQWYIDFGDLRVFDTNMNRKTRSVRHMQKTSGINIKCTPTIEWTKTESKHTSHTHTSTAHTNSKQVRSIELNDKEWNKEY